MWRPDVALSGTSRGLIHDPLPDSATFGPVTTTARRPRSLHESRWRSVPRELGSLFPTLPIVVVLFTVLATGIWTGLSTLVTFFGVFLIIGRLFNPHYRLYLTHGLVVSFAAGLFTWILSFPWPIFDSLRQAFLPGWIVDPVLDHGLVAAVESLAVRSPVPVTLTNALPTLAMLSQEIERNAYFVAGELLPIA